MSAADDDIRLGYIHDAERNTRHAIVGLQRIAAIGEMGVCLKHSDFEPVAKRLGKVLVFLEDLREVLEREVEQEAAIDGAHATEARQ